MAPANFLSVTMFITKFIKCTKANNAVYFSREIKKFTAKMGDEGFASTSHINTTNIKVKFKCYIICLKMAPAAK